jgi:hypothetical protein
MPPPATAQTLCTWQLGRVAMSRGRLTHPGLGQVFAADGRASGAPCRFTRDSGTRSAGQSAENRTEFNDRAAAQPRRRRLPNPTANTLRACLCTSTASASRCGRSTEVPDGASTRQKQRCRRFLAQELTARCAYRSGQCSQHKSVPRTSCPPEPGRRRQSRDGTRRLFRLRIWDGVNTRVPFAMPGNPFIAECLQ